MRRSGSCCSTSCYSGMSYKHNDDDDLDLGLSINTQQQSNSSLFVKVYMEGHPIGRKLDMLSINGYSHLISTLDRMFNANILSDSQQMILSHHHHVLTYEDEEGDWMMVGDVPWELFLSAVKRLKISRACPS